MDGTVSTTLGEKKMNCCTKTLCKEAHLGGGGFLNLSKNQEQAPRTSKNKYELLA